MVLEGKTSLEEVVDDSLQDNHSIVVTQFMILIYRP